MEKGRQQQMLYQQRLLELQEEQKQLQQQQQLHQQLHDGRRKEEEMEKQVPIYAVPMKKHKKSHDGDPLPNTSTVSNGFAHEIQLPGTSVILQESLHTVEEAPPPVKDTPPPPMKEAPPKVPPPLPPPRNYQSQYRTQFHSRQSSEELLDSPRAGVRESPRGGAIRNSPRATIQDSPRAAGSSRLVRQRTGSERGSAVSRSNSTATNQSLLDLADELGGGNSSVSVHSSLGRQSQEGVGPGRPGSGSRRRSQDGVSILCVCVCEEDIWRAGAVSRHLIKG